jgi:GNAT superfamily N-acetyltransferase
VTSLAGAWSFYRRHGVRSTLARCVEALRRLSYSGRMILFVCPLPSRPPLRPAGVSVERLSVSTLAQADCGSLFGSSDPADLARRLADRFSAGSELWLARVTGRPAGFGWTIRGRAFEPHFFPIQADEVHLFDFFVAADFRGRGVNGALMAECLARLGEQGVRVAHLECAAWNAGQLASLQKTPFRRCASARKLTLFGRPLVLWQRGPRPPTSA